MSEQQETCQAPRDFLCVLLQGFKVWARELGRMVGTSMRRFEISRLEKQLEEEYGLLGRIAEAPRGKMKEKEQSLNQIAFLKEEIETLRNELDQRNKQAGA